MPISHLMGDSFYQPPTEGSTTEDDDMEHITTAITHGLRVSPSNNNHPHPPLQISSQPHKTRYVLIDTDAGTEDAWALFMLLSAHRFNKERVKIVGITTIYGNTSVENVGANVSRVLQTVDEQSIPVYPGMNSSLVGKFVHSGDPYHGVDGFGDANLEHVPVMAQHEHAVEAIIKYADMYPGELTILALGPLTNLAMAVKLRPNLRNLVKEIYILGGNMEGVGNVTVSSEFNFFVDPEAAHAVLEDFQPCPIFILPWETCIKFGTFSHSWRTNVVGNMHTPEMLLLNQIEDKILSSYRDNWLVSDAILTACFLNPKKVIRKKESYHCEVELSGSHTRGMLIVDKAFMKQKPSNVTLITEIDRDMYEAMLVWAIGGKTRKRTHQ